MQKISYAIGLIWFLASCSFISGYGSQSDSSSIAENLKKDYYPASLSEKDLTKLNSDDKMLQGTITILQKDSESSQPFEKQVIDSNVARLQQIWQKMQDQMLLQEYGAYYNLDYLTNNLISTTSEYDISLYTLLQNNESFRANLQHQLENFLLDSPDITSTYYASKNLSYLKSNVFNNPTANVNFPDNLLTNKLGELKFGIVSEVNNSSVEINLLLYNSGNYSNYLEISNPSISELPDMSSVRIDNLADSEFRNLNPESKNLLNYQFISDQSTSGKNLRFLVKINGQSFYFPINN